MTALSRLDALLEQHVAVIGKTGSGKSYASRGLVERLLELGRRVCILDYTGVWYGLRRGADGSKGHDVIIAGGQHGDVALHEGAAATLARFIAHSDRSVVIDLDGLSIGAQQRFVTAFLEELYRLNSRTLHLVLEEVDEFCPQTGAPGAERMIGAVARVFQRGRRKGFRALAITQRPANVHKRVLAQCHAMIALKLMAPQDRKAVADWIRGNADAETGKAVVDSLPKLQRGEGWIWAPEEEILERVRFPQIRTLDTMRAPETDEEAEEPDLGAIDIAELRQMLAPAEEGDKKAPSVSLTIDPKLVDEAFARGREEGYREGHEHGFRGGVRLERDRWLIALRDFASATGGEDAVPGRPRDEEQSPYQAAPPAPAKIDGNYADPIPVAPKVPQGTSRSLPPAAPGRRHEGITGPQQKILDALAWWESVGITVPRRVQVAVVAGYSPEGGAFQNPLGGLRTAGLIEYPAPGWARLTSEGRRAANKPARSATTPELHQKIMAILDGPRQRILLPLLRAYPRAITREELAKAAGYEPTGGAFQNPLGALRSLGLIDYPEKGKVVALPVLFVEERG